MSGRRDYGLRQAVTGGKQMDGFVVLIRELLRDCGIPLENLYIDKRDVVLPGYFRPTKQWDLVVIHNGNLAAILEFKSQIGSFGNNFNNRVEEAIGNAVDLHTAYREGAFEPSSAPWLGYLMFLQESNESLRPVRVDERHYDVFEDFRGTSYAQRYELLCKRLVRERLYDAACLLMSNEEGGLNGEYSEPSTELCFQNFAASIVGHVAGLIRTTDR